MVTSAETGHSHAPSRLNKWLADLKLLGSLYVAYVIVWREMRRERREGIELKLEEVSRCKI